MKKERFAKKQQQKEIKDIRFGNKKSKVVSFHKGQGQVHEADREKGSSIMANLNA